MKTWSIGVLAALGCAAMAQAGPLDRKDCVRIHDQLSFCDQAHAWDILDIPAGDGLLVFRNKDIGFGKIIVEPTTSDSVEHKKVEAAILNDLNLKRGDHNRGFDIERSVGGILDGRSAGNLRYRLAVDGADLLALHSYMVSDGLVMQFITVTPDGVEDTFARSLHTGFMGSFELSEPAPAL